MGDAQAELGDDVPAPVTGLSAWVTHEVLGAEQWIGAGSTVWQVIDTTKATPEDSRGIVHQAQIIPVARRLRCRLWGLLHGYGWLPVVPAGGVGADHASA